MKANAPEKLYLSKNIYSTYLYQVPDPDDDTTVEYTRTDAFIEKVCAWLKSKGGFTIGFSGAEIEDFRNYMQNL